MKKGKQAGGGVVIGGGVRGGGRGEGGGGGGGGGGLIVVVAVGFRLILKHPMQQGVVGSGLEHSTPQFSHESLPVVIWQQIAS